MPWRSLRLLVIGLVLWVTPALADEPPRVHTVYPGQTLGMIAKRYVVSVEAICNANGIRRRDPIRPGQKLAIPTRKDEDGERAKEWVERGKLKAKGVPAPPETTRGAAAKREPERARPGADYARYFKPARRKGYVILKGTGRSWSGYAIVKGNRIASRAHQAFRRVLYSWRTGAEHDVDPKLIRLLTEVSDRFGGRPLRIASGFREHSFARESKHKLGRACDFSIEGVPNEALYEYLSTLQGVGVGYYPNSTFVHLDVRSKTTRWEDHSAPGEAPRRAGDAGP